MINRCFWFVAACMIAAFTILSCDKPTAAVTSLILLKETPLVALPTDRTMPSETRCGAFFSSMPLAGTDDKLVFFMWGGEGSDKPTLGVFWEGSVIPQRDESAVQPTVTILEIIEPAGTTKQVVIRLSPAEYETARACLVHSHTAHPSDSAYRV